MPELARRADCIRRCAGVILRLAGHATLNGNSERPPGYLLGVGRELMMPADQINLEFVLGNKVMIGTVNANREYFEAGVRDMALADRRIPAGCRVC
jgi:hypothetical protein